MHPGLAKAALLGCLGLFLAGTSSRALAQVNDKTEATLTLVIVDGSLPIAQRLIKVRKGDKLRWRISSNTAGSLHLHAYRLIAPLQAGQTTELAFDAFATGRFRLEWHGEQDQNSGNVGHHAPPVATLEVLPR
jgi:hypothetical protein